MRVKHCSELRYCDVIKKRKIKDQEETWWMGRFCVYTFCILTVPKWMGFCPSQGSCARFLSPADA